MPVCEFGSCSVSACFNLFGEQKAKFCKTHKMDEMINIVDKLCETCNVKRALYNYKGKTGGIYCLDHMVEGMVNVKGKRFAYKGLLGNEICYTAPIYNYDGQLKGLYCIEHKAENMINVTGKRCSNNDCKSIAQFNFDGNITGKYCSQHKEDGMIDIKHKRCEYKNCMNQPSYKFENDSSCKFCSKHKLEGMVNGKHSICKIENCNKYAGYNYIGIKTPLYCGEHKKENMIDVKHHFCLETDCNKRPIFNFEGCKKGIYCTTHKKDNMINIFMKICKSIWCNGYPNPKYDNYCINCFIHLFPEKQISRNYKTKEKTVVDFIQQMFDNSWICDKRIVDGCSKRRPDLLLDMGSHVIIIEIDKNQHVNYDCSCENKRLMELSQDVGHRPIVFIRFNPDDYIDSNSKKIKSCWIPNKSNGLLYIPKIKETEWSNRLTILKNHIQYWINNKTEKTIEIIQLFYNGMPT
jgi:hypothetical protein